MSESKSVHTELDALKADLVSVKADLKSLTEAAVAAGRETATATKNQVDEKLNEGCEAVRQQVNERPLTMLGGAFVVGMLAAALLKRG